MIRIHSKTLQDLEFHTVLEQVSEFCITGLGKSAMSSIVPFEEKEIVVHELQLTHEYVASFANENRIPNHGFDPITKELQLLGIENSFLEPYSFKKFASISKVSNELITFFKKFEEYYPTLHQNASEIELTKVIIDSIEAIIDRFGDVKNRASEELYRLRKEIGSVKGKINQSFNAALTHCASQDYLDDIRETVIENKRVLAVKAMYRRKVKGSILGGSKTGSIVYIEPEATFQHTRALNNLQYEEKQEVEKVLRQLTETIRPFRALLGTYQEFLVKMDVISAKAKYAESINGILPKLNNNKTYEVKDAYHPLLYVSNRNQGQKTYPQSIQLNPENRIIVISGPNAGGKSITLKTVGLLQLMLQSGMLVPVHERSTVCFFDRIITDIGDNQSIENHLSTYSYRLKQMNYFLKKCNKNTLFLIDEFGTGSDPELGGALAETFLEEFYNREAYGIYNNPLF